MNIMIGFIQERLAIRELSIFEDREEHPPCGKPANNESSGFHQASLSEKNGDEEFSSRFGFFGVSQL